MLKKTLFASLVLAISAFAGVPVSPDAPVAPARAEASQCGGVALDEATRDQVYSSAYAARPIRQRIFMARAIQPRRTMGATLHVYAQPGMTQEYLERVLECHARRGQAVNSADPLVITEGSVRDVDVSSAGGAFAVHIMGDSPAAGRAIYERAENLVRGSVSVQQF